MTRTTATSPAERAKLILDGLRDFNVSADFISQVQDRLHDAMAMMAVQADVSPNGDMLEGGDNDAMTKQHIDVQPSNDIDGVQMAGITGLAAPCGVLDGDSKLNSSTRL